MTQHNFWSGCLIRVKGEPADHVGWALRFDAVFNLLNTKPFKNLSSQKILHNEKQAV